MPEPAIGGRRPAVLDLEAGNYAWCACGMSKNQPWCDGSHRGSEFSPIKFELAEAKRCAMCTCKRSGNKPYCDGTHKTLPPEPVAA